MGRLRSDLVPIKMHEKSYPVVSSAIGVSVEVGVDDAKGEPPK